MTANALPDLSRVDFCYVTSRGRRTGRPHTIEIWFEANGATLYLLSGGGDRSDWVRNLRAESSATVRVGEREWDATARPVTDPAEDALARRLLAAKYQDWREGKPLSRWAATALPVALDLTT
ncbi:MAG: nitroreductase family deazaflavin-dependent oxidoreductase [Actinomycetota bacterium]